MELEKQIEMLQEIGFQFREAEHVQRILDCYEWWQYYEAPFVLLLQHIYYWSACEQTRVCLNPISWDFRSLRSNGWFEKIVYDLAKLSSSETRLRVRYVREDLDNDSWVMEYRLRDEKSRMPRSIETKYPHKHAPWGPAIEMAKDFETRAHCFVNFDAGPHAGPLLCWLPKNKIGKLEGVLSGKFQLLTNAG